MKKYLLMLFAMITMAMPVTLSSCSSDDDDTIESSIRNADDLFNAIDKAIKYSSAKSYEAYPYLVTRLGSYIVVKIKYGTDDYTTLLAAIKAHYGSRIEDAYINKGGTISIIV
jgi:hypothetical protein